MPSLPSQSSPSRVSATTFKLKAFTSSETLSNLLIPQVSVSSLKKLGGGRVQGEYKPWQLTKRE